MALYVNRNLYRRSAEDRFLSYIEPEPMSGCWLWTGSLRPDGYGEFRIGGRDGRTVRAHYMSYIRVHGFVPKRRQLDHKCRVRCCVNPDHLRPVTSYQNSHAPGSLHNCNKTKCSNGHPLDGIRFVNHKARRYCLTCNRTRSAASYAKRRHG